jgi:hypothetical protein
MKKPLARPAASIPAVGRRGLHANEEPSSMAESLFQQKGRTGRACQPMSGSGHIAAPAPMRRHVRTRWKETCVPLQLQEFAEEVIELGGDVRCWHDATSRRVCYDDRFGRCERTNSFQ